MKLFAKWNSKTPWTAEDAVRRISNQKKLARIAVEAHAWEARKLAVENLDIKHHHHLLTGIARDDVNGLVRIAARKRLIARSHELLLEKIATTDADYDVCLEAIKKLTGTEPPGNPSPAVATDESLKIRMEEMEQLIGESHRLCSVEVAKATPGPSAVEEIMGIISDQKILFDLVMNVKDFGVRRAALRRITDKGLLRRLIVRFGEGLNGKYEKDRKQNEDLLLFIYDKYDDVELRKEIAEYDGMIIQDCQPETGHWEDGAGLGVNKSYHIDAPPRSARRFHVPEAL
ncbi:MAG: hypothetical protein LBC81_04470 [Tannerellaceae bacterium]|jgi:hypothetical protein|nr:hypothetical protein [Tannerellaceae bacterium]